MKKILFNLFLCLFLIAFTTVPVFAETTDTTDPAASLSVGSATVNQGSSFTLAVNAENLADVIGLDFEIYYDPTILTLNSYTLSGLEPAYTSVNDSEAGILKVSSLSLTGLNGTFTALKLNFSVSQNTEPGNIRISAAVGNAYNSAFEDVSVTGVPGIVTVKEKTEIVNTVQFFSGASPSSLEKGDVTTITFGSWNIYGLAAGVFDIVYDAELFELVDFSVGSNMQTETGIFSVNDSNPGYICMSYASATAVRSGNLFTVQLKDLQNTEAV